MLDENFSNFEVQVERKVRLQSLRLQLIVDLFAPCYNTLGKVRIYGVLRP